MILSNKSKGCPSLCIGDTPPASVLDELDILIERALVDLEGRGLPLCLTTFELFRGDLQLDRVLYRVDGDDVPVTNERDGSTNLCLRHDVSDAEPVGSAQRRHVHR